MTDTCGWASLPTELKLAVLEYIPNPKDSQSLRLVNRNLDDIASPILLRSVTLPLDDLEQLLRHVQASRHLGKVRELCVHVRSQEGLSLGYLDGLQALFDALLTDTLLKVALPALSPRLLHSLAMSQKKIESLEVSGYGEETSCSLHPTVLVPTSLTSLTYRLHYGNGRDWSLLWALVYGSRHLQHLHLATSTKAYMPTSSGTSSFPLTIKSLHLHNLVLRNEDLLSKNMFNFRFLTSLRLQGLETTIETLQILTSVFRTGKMVTTKLWLGAELESYEDGLCLIRRLSRFLYSFTGLEELRVEFTTKENTRHNLTLPPQSLVSKHAHSLRLLVCDWQASRGIALLIDQLPNLEQLGIRLPSGFRLGATGTSTAVVDNNACDTFIERLQQLTGSTLPRLHTLRLLNAPKLVSHVQPLASNTEVNIEASPQDLINMAAQSQLWMQSFANWVFQILSLHGSNVQVLGQAPGLQSTLGENVLEDDNGHRWPKYIYRKGRVADTEDVVAIPVRNWRVEVPNSTIFEN